MEQKRTKYNTAAYYNLALNRAKRATQGVSK